MNTALRIISLAAAVALPAAGIAGTAAPAFAAKDRFERVKPHVAPHHKAHIKKLVLRRCMISVRRAYWQERRRLGRMGYRKIRYTGGFSFRPRCWTTVRLSACRGFRKYNFEIRYQYGRRIQTFRYNAGRCFHRPYYRRGS